MRNPTKRLIGATMVAVCLAVAVTAATAETVDLIHGNTGTITGVPGGTARFDFMMQQPTGTGVIKPFLRVQAFPQEQGYNTSGVTPKAPFDDKAGPWTHDITYADLLQTAVNIDGITYFKLLLDVNEPNGKKSLISLDQLQFYTSPIGSQTTSNVAMLGTLRFSFKPPITGGSSNDMVLMDASRNHGSGSGDMYAYIPAAAFAGTLPTDFVYMYVFFGAHQTADIFTGGGFEEWALVLNAAPATPTPTATPTATPTPTPTPTPTAPPRPTPCLVQGAMADSCYTLRPAPCTSGQAFWFPNADCSIPEGNDCANPGSDPSSGTDGFKYVFSPCGSFTEDPDSGTATLTGHLESSLHPGYGFDVNITFSNRTNDPTGGMGPRLELEQTCYSSNGGPVNPATWHFYAVSGGTLTGTGNYAGAVVQLTGVMHYYQVGAGASGKNVLDGSSGWFDWVIAHQPNNPAFCLRSGAQVGRTADFNINCGNCTNPTGTPTPTPTPATPTPTPTKKHGK